MSDESDEGSPKIRQYLKKIETKEKTFTLYLFVVEYSNAIQVAVYENKPSLGSMSFGYINGDLSEKLEIFSGNHNQYSNALALILAKRLGKVIYASVNLNRDTIVDLSMIKGLLENYFQDLVAQ